MSDFIFHKGEDWIDLSNLPIERYNYKGELRKKPTVNWKKCNGNIVKFYIDSVYGELEVHSINIHEKGNRYVKITYDGKEFIIHNTSLKRMALHNVIYYKNSEFKYDVGDTVNNGTVVERIRKENNGKLYKMICNTYGEVYYRNETELNRHRGSPYVTGDKVCYENSLYKHKEVLKYVKNIEDAKLVTAHSNKYILCKCPTCGDEKTVRVYLLTKYGMGCQKCKSHISYPEKLMIALLEYNNIQYEYQKRFDFAPNRFYDFYLPEYNTVIETHGEQHYNVSNTSHWKTRAEIDKEKEEFLNTNDINLCVIDCRKSEYDYIIRNIENSCLNNIFMDVDGDYIKRRVYNEYLSKDKKYAIYEYKKGRQITDIAEEIGYSFSTVYRWVHRLGIFENRRTSKK